MASKAPPPASMKPPAGVPSSGSGMYILLALVLVGVIVAAILWKTCQTTPTPPPPLVADAGPRPTLTGRNPDDDVPLPPPTEDAGPDGGKKTVITQNGLANQCDARKCVGQSGVELENALAFRVKQAHRCYDNALAQDPTLRGKVTVAVRVGANGQVCSAGVASNEMSSPQVAQCVTGYFRGANVPSPKGGCVDVNIPINFVPRQ